MICGVGYSRPYCQRCTADKRLYPFGIYCRTDFHIFEFDRSVITLQHDRTGISFIAVQRTAGYTGNFTLIDDQNIIEFNGHTSPDQRDFKGIPLICGRFEQRIR